MNHPTPQDVRRGGIGYATTMILSGTIGLVVVAADQPSINVVFFRCVIASAILGAFCLATRRFTPDFFTRGPLIATFVAGTALVANWVLLFESYRHVPIGIATVVFHLKPFILLLYGQLLLGDRITWPKLFWMTTGFLGFLAIARLDRIDGGLAGDGYLLGIGLALGAALLQPISTVAILKSLKPFSPYVIALGQFVLGILFLAPLLETGDLPVTAVQWGCLAILGIVHTVVMYSLMYMSLPRIRTALIAILQFLYPVTALVVDYVVFDTVLDLHQALGVAAIMLAILGTSLNWTPAALFRRAAHHQKKA